MDLLLAELPTAPSIIIANDLRPFLSPDYQVLDFTVLQDHANFTLDGTGLFLTSKAVAVAANTLNVQTLKGSNKYFQ